MNCGAPGAGQREIEIAKKGMGNLLQKLIDNGADIHAQSKADASPVFIAVFNDHIAIATKLIHLGAQPVSIESHVNDTFATAKLYKLMAEIREKEGNKPEAADHYQTAATFFEKSSAGFKEKAGERKWPLGEPQNNSLPSCSSEEASVPQLSILHDIFYIHDVSIHC